LNKENKMKEIEFKDQRQKEIYQEIMRFSKPVLEDLERSKIELVNLSRLIDLLEYIEKGLENQEYHIELRKEAVRTFSNLSSQLVTIQKRDGYHKQLIKRIRKKMIEILGNYKSEDPEIIQFAITTINRLFEKADAEIVLPIINSIIVDMKDELEILYNAANILWRESEDKSDKLFTNIYLDNNYSKKFHNHVFAYIRGYISKTKDWKILEKIVVKAIRSSDIETRNKALDLIIYSGYKGLCEKEIQDALKEENDDKYIEKLIHALKTVGTIRSLKILREIRMNSSPKISEAADEACQAIAMREGYSSDADLIKDKQPQKRSWVEHLRFIAVIISLFGFFTNFYFNINPIEAIKSWHRIFQWFMLSFSIIFLLIYIITSISISVKSKNFKKKMEFK